jgi:hypothetical protein
VILVAIHQPNFLPWLGYFDKIRRSRIFIVLDDVQFEKGGAGTWSNRVQLRIAGGAHWITVPIVRAYHGTRSYAEMQIDESSSWREKLMRTIAMNYRRAPHFEDVFPVVGELIRNQSSRLLDYNLEAIRAIASRLGLDQTNIVLSSSLQVKRRSTERLVDLVQAAGGDAYLAGGGAGGYQDDRLFAASGIRLVYQEFAHPTYRQQGAPEFLPGLSIIDALLNVGFEGTAELLAEGERS